MRGRRSFDCKCLQHTTPWQQLFIAFKCVVKKGKGWAVRRAICKDKLAPCRVIVSTQLHIEERGKSKQEKRKVEFLLNSAGSNCIERSPASKAAPGELIPLIASRVGAKRAILLSLPSVRPTDRPPARFPFILARKAWWNVVVVVVQSCTNSPAVWFSYDAAVLVGYTGLIDWLIDRLVGHSWRPCAAKPVASSFSRLFLMMMQLPPTTTKSNNKIQEDEPTRKKEWKKILLAINLNRSPSQCVCIVYIITSAFDRPILTTLWVPMLIHYLHFYCTTGRYF